MFRWVEVRTHCHATEDEERVLAALRTVVPDADARREAVEGHFGNPIVTLTVRTDRGAEAMAIWKRVVKGLGRADVLREVPRRLDDDGVYHARLDKQAAFRGRIELTSDGDVIVLRAKVAAFPNRREVAEGVLRAATEGD